jgi:hypothetical protein
LARTIADLEGNQYIQIDHISEAIQYRKLIETSTEPVPLTEAFHSHLIDLLRRYYFVGGLSEAGEHFATTGSGQSVREIQEEIMKSYVLDFAKHAPATDIPTLTKIWDSIPGHLARESKNPGCLDPPLLLIR